MGGTSTTVTGTITSLPSVGLLLWSSTMMTWVIPTLYPANPCTAGAPLYSGHEPYRGTGLFARFRGLYARDPLRGLLNFGMFQSTLRAL